MVSDSLNDCSEAVTGNVGLAFGSPSCEVTCCTSPCAADGFPIKLAEFDLLDGRKKSAKCVQIRRGPPFLNILDRGIPCGRRGNISGRAAKSTASMPALRERFVLKTRTPEACPDLLPRPLPAYPLHWHRADNPRSLSYFSNPAVSIFLNSAIRAVIRVLLAFLRPSSEKP